MSRASGATASDPVKASQGGTVRIRIESLSYRASKAIVLANWLALLAGTCGVIALFVAKLRNSDASSLENTSLFLANTIAACTCTAALLVGAVWLLANIVRASFYGRWDRFRAHEVATNLVQVLALLFILACTIASNVRPIKKGRCWYGAADNFFTLMETLRETGWNVIFALLVVQAHSLCLVTNSFRQVMTGLSNKMRSVAAAASRQRWMHAGGDCGGAQEQACNVALPSAVSGTGGGSKKLHCASNVAVGALGKDGTQLVAMASLRHHLLVLLVFLGVEGMILAKYFNEKSRNEEGSANLEAYSDYASSLGSGSPDPAYISGVLDSVNSLNETSARILKEDPGLLLPSNISLRTGLRPANTVPVHIYGPDPADTMYPHLNSLAWTLYKPYPDYFEDFAHYRVHQDPALYTNSTFALEALGGWFWMVRVPMEYWCSGLDGMQFDDVLNDYESNMRELRQALYVASCEETKDDSCFPQRCPISGSVLQYSIIANALLLSYVVLYIFYLYRAVQTLGRHAYLKYRLPNILVAMQLREGMPVFVFFFVGVTSLAYINPENCFSAMMTGTGILPIMVVATVMWLCRCYHTSPCVGVSAHMDLQSELQRVAYLEEEVPDVIASRGGSGSGAGYRFIGALMDASRDAIALGLGDHGQQQAQQQEEPVFCMQAALKGAFWSVLAYRHCEEGASSEPTYTLEAAMSLDGLVGSRLIYHKGSDTAALAAWRPGLLVLAFRGTASAINAKTDVKALQIRHPRAKGWGFIPPMVHKGFIAAWETVRETVMNVARDAPIDPSGGSLRVFVTGHSLGGALATLAAFDVQQLLAGLHPGEGKVHVTCYTYGAPRCANHKLAAVYKRAVPDTWDIANDQDVVPKSTKWMRVYKRTGHRVIISKKGDILVRPSFIEMTIKSGLGGSAADHLMGSYFKSLGAILEAQLDPCKCLEGGPDGVLRMAQDEHASFIMRECLGCSMQEACDRENDGLKGLRAGDVSGESSSVMAAVGADATEMAGGATRLVTKACNDDNDEAHKASAVSAEVYDKQDGINML